jgi:ABC transporter with metal-binding/Fe-S-binding domain ATP-binding protein
LASGGKDSALALYHVLKEGHKVECLATMIPLRDDSWMFHFPNIRLVNLFAEAVDVPLAKGETEGVKEEEVEDLGRLLEKLHVEGVVSGAIASSYQKQRIDRLCEKLGMVSLAPLWGIEPIAVLRELQDLQFQAIITAVFAYGFNEEWLGRTVDNQTVKELENLNRRYGISIVGEGGEYESFVLDGPIFKKRIRIVEAEKTWKNQTGYYNIKKAELESK